MSQHDMILANADGATFRADLNSALAALATTSKGSTRPSTISAGQLWLDDNSPSSSRWTLYLYDGSDDIALGEFDTSANVFYATAPTASADTNTTQVATTAFVLGQAASQNELEAASSTTKLASPGRMKYHPGVAKAWINFTPSNPPVIQRSHNVASISRTGAGDYNITLTEGTSDTACAVFASSDTFGLVAVPTQTSTTVFRVRFHDADTASTLADPTRASLIVYGDF
ncbi:hypothetical protein [Tautonia plasticadhaerens]|uniref:Uncharacterized protein n=1 Tax=Tautonia plasticadhaerens TaxID=2527974 RepID=A0A518H232_9BACT|nr:hypothetical protein [Tautonia plasticadhaerens]QDV34892.1 hypothetical protein ElP_27890 [Tautonia plasticadhaerens]